MTVRGALLAALLLVFAGCASQQWQKPGGIDAERARDRDDCSRQAREQSFHELNARLLSQPYGTGIDRQGNATLAPPLAAEGDRIMIEQSLLRDCMRLRGYELAREPRGSR